jgi:1,4-dihydroxy-2-naphthoate octaprenyltransferase
MLLYTVPQSSFETFPHGKISIFVCNGFIGVYLDPAVTDAARLVLLSMFNLIPTFAAALVAAILALISNCFA